MRPKASKPTPHERYWQKRMRSTAFRRALKALIARELSALAGEPIGEVVDAALVRRIIQEWDAKIVNREMIADLFIAANRRAAGRRKRRDDSLFGLLDPKLVEDIEALLEEDVTLSADAEQFVARLMQQEFVRRLFTDIIFTAIVSFNQRVNPLFAAMTMRVMEEQIKGFIRLFMPMLQRQATAFAVSPDNQRIVLGFVRSIIRQLLNEPLPHYAALVSPAQRRKAEALIKRAVGNAKLDALIRTATLAAWDDVYKTIRHRKVGELLQLDKHAGWLADRSVEAILPALARPEVVRFIASEMAVADEALHRQE